MISIAADGRIEINTKINDDGIEQGGNRISSIMGRIAKSVRGVANANAEAFGAKTQAQLDKLTQKLERQQEAARKAAREVDSIRREYESISGAETTPASLKRTESELERVQKEIQKVEKEYSNLEEQLNKVQTAAEFEKMASGAISPGNVADIERLVGELDKTGSRLGELDDKAQALQSSIEKIKLNPEQSAEAQKLADRLQTAEEKAERLANEANYTAEQIKQIAMSGEKIPEAPEKASKSMERLTKSTRKANRELQGTNKSAGGLLGTVDKLHKRILRLAAAALVFNVIRRAFTQLRNYMWSVMKTNDQFVASLASVKGNLLTAFQPIYEAILPALNALAAALAKVTAYLAAFVNLLFGKSISASKDSAKNLYDQAKALEATGSAANKASKQLAAFDEINKLASDTAGGGGGSDVITPDFDYDVSFGDFEDRLNDLLDVFRKAWANVGDYVIDGWNRALKNTLELAKKIGSTFYEVWTDGHGQALLESWLTLLGTILNIIGDIAHAFSIAWDSHGYDLVVSIFEALEDIGELLNSIGVSFRWAWNDGTGERIASNILQIFTNINKTISELSKRLREAWNANQNGEAIWKAILGIVDDTLESVRGISEATVEWAQNLNLEPLISGFRDVLEAIRPVVDIITDALAWAYENVLLPFSAWLLEIAVPAALDLLAKAFELLGAVFEAIKPGITWIWEEFLKPLAAWTGGKIIEVLDFIGEKFKQVTEWIKENGEDINNVLISIGTIFKALWEDWISPTLDTVWEGIKGVVDSILEILAGLITFLSGVFTGDWAKAWEGVKQIFAGVWNGIAVLLETVLNSIVGGINSLINMLNKIKIDLPSWVEKVTGYSSWGFNIPNIGNVSIPKLATGAVVPPNNEFLAVLGDNKREPEIVSPLSTMKQALAEVLGEVGIGGGEQTINLHVHLDGDEIYSDMIKVAKRKGSSVIGGQNFVLEGM